MFLKRETSKCFLYYRLWFYSYAPIFFLYVIFIRRIFKSTLFQELPKIFEFVFDCTLDMIKSDFHSFPDHRAKFYELLRVRQTVPDYIRALLTFHFVWLSIFPF